MSGRRRPPWWIVFVLGAVLFWPSIRTTFLLDDYLHMAMVEGTFPAPRGPFDLYDFVDDDDRPALVERGLLPWWSHPKLTLRFFRPLSSALRWADHKAFVRSALPMHLHSVAWWIAAVFSVRMLLLRTLSRRAAAIGTFVFALAPCHAMPIAWLANREALVSLTFGALALGAHVRWRETSRPRDAVLAAILFGLALLGGGEYAIAFGAYVLAMEIVPSPEPRPIARRLVGLAPFVAPATLYLVVRGLLGYGAFGSGFYADPLRVPLSFLREAPWRVVALVGEGWFSIDSRDWQSTGARIALAGIVLCAMALTVVVARRAMACLDGPARSSAAWMLLGSLLAVVPALAVIPAPRVLGVSVIGMAAVVAVVLDEAWFGALAERKTGDLTQTVAIVLGFAHLVHGPISSWFWSREFHGDAERVAANAHRLVDNVGEPTRAQLGVVRGTVGMFFAPFLLDPHGRTPARWVVLSEAAHVLTLRKDARTLELIAPVGRGLFPGVTGSLLRTPDAPLHAGDVVTVPGMRVTVLDVTEGAGARDVVFTFDRDLDEDPAITWINETHDDWTVVRLPKAGYGSPFDP